jgi:hypothetical protein
MNEKVSKRIKERKEKRDKKGFLAIKPGLQTKTEEKDVYIDGNE